VTRSALPFAALAFCLFAGPAVAGVDLPVSATSSVEGTIAPAGEREVFSFRATAGTAKWGLTPAVRGQTP